MLLQNYLIKHETVKHISLCNSIMQTKAEVILKWILTGHSLQGTITIENVILYQTAS